MYRIFVFFKDCDPYITDLGTWNFDEDILHSLSNALGKLSAIDLDCDGLVRQSGLYDIVKLISNLKPIHQMYVCDPGCWIEFFRII